MNFRCIWIPGTQLNDRLSELNCVFHLATARVTIKQVASRACERSVSGAARNLSERERSGEREWQKTMERERSAERAILPAQTSVSARGDSFRNVLKL